MKKTVMIIAILAATTSFAADPVKSTATRSNTKTWNIMTGPIGDIVGVFNIMAQYNLGSGWTVGGTAASFNWKLGDIKLAGSALSARVNYHLNGEAFNDGWYLGGALGTFNAKVNQTVSSVEYEGSASVATYRAFGGYMWLWDTFNIMLGLDFGSASGDITMKDTAGNTKTYSGGLGPNGGLEFNIGWAF